MDRKRFVWLSLAAVVIGAMVCRGAGAAQETPAKSYAVTIDTAKVAEPISKYIYGQFIEHLGRCIYGGIWAEMLEDRKFLYPVDSDQSPWRSITGAKRATMTREKPYVGEHCPIVHVAAKAGGGISQSGLALRKGQEYVGRVVLAAEGPSVGAEVCLYYSLGVAKSVSFSNIPADYTTYDFRLVPDADTDDGYLTIAGNGVGSLRIGAVSLMPADNVKGMRADTLKLLKELNSPIYRWPGGNFVSGYDWRLGIGPRDKRPPMKNPAWGGIEHNDFGLDEFIIFCREIGTEPMITVNTGFGDDHSAAEEVEYANGSPNTPMGKWRAANGHREPYNVTWWCVGNEMYGNWQLGHMSLEHYVRKHNLFAKAMRQVDPSIKLMAVGAVGDWSEGMLKNCVDGMDLISEHFYKGAKKDVLEHVRQAPEAVRHIVSAHRDYRKKLDSIKGKDIRIAIDEWNYWYGEHLFGELGTRYFLRDALGIAAGLHEMIRSSDLVFMANYAQTVNVIGAIKTTKTAAAFETTGLTLKLYRDHFGQLPVAVTGEVTPLDIVAAWTGDKKALSIGVVNPTEQQCELTLDVKGSRLGDKGRVWVISHSDPMAYNEPGKQPNVAIKEQRVSDASSALKLPAYSINIYKLPVR
jgi:alpha-N-arabinofuranosidase